MLNCTGLFAPLVLNLAQSVQGGRKMTKLEKFHAAQERKEQKQLELTEKQTIILQLIAGNPSCSRIELKEMSGIELPLLRLHLKSLESAGKIENVGTIYTPEYKVKK